MTTKQRFYFSWTMMVAAAVIVIAANTIFIPATSYIAKDLGTDEATMSSNMVFSRISMIVCMFCFGAFADLFSSRRLMQTGLVICTVSCALSAVAKNIYVFDIAQVIEAVSRATIMLTMQLWIAGISNKDNLASRLSWYSILITMSPILAPSAGGMIAESASWQYCFIVLSVLCLAMLAGLTVFRIQEATPANDKPRTKFAPMETLRQYREVVFGSPLLKLNFSLIWMAWFDGGFMAIVSFLFVDELGLNAAELGGIIMIQVAGIFLGRFPIMYFQKHYGARVTFLYHQAVVLLATFSAFGYHLVTGRQDIWEIAIVIAVIGFGSSGMYIYCLRNSMMLEPEKKSVYTSLFNTMYNLAALLGVLTIQGLYMAGFTSVNIFLTLIGVATVCMLLGTLMHLSALRKVNNNL